MMDAMNLTLDGEPTPDQPQKLGAAKDLFVKAKDLLVTEARKHRVGQGTHVTLNEVESQPIVDAFAAAKKAAQAITPSGK